MVIAKYGADWQYLSDEHEEIARLLGEMLDDYGNGQLDHLSYAVIGTFGVGKTQFLFHIFKTAKEKGLLPLYWIAEDLFREVITSSSETATPGDIYQLIEQKVENLKKALSEKNEAKVWEILDPRGKLRNDTPELVDLIIKEFSRPEVYDNKIVLLVDELEGQYGVLQEKTQTKDRSPLRDWLESKSYLKFLAFAPAGIYELGGADRGRVKRIVLPPADTDYIRKNLVKDAGRSNACWWLSRGKARQLFKACEVLNRRGPVADADVASRILKQELDWIGQAPTQVPPAFTSAIEPSKIPILLSLCPREGQNSRRYVIDVSKLRTGQLADKLIEAFAINKDNAMLISEYFKRTVKTLSNEDNFTYIENEELPELFCLVFDHLLEYEHGSPEVSGNLGEILNLYEKVGREKAALYGIIGTLWELKETKFQLPLTIGEIRKTFPFPTMNPIIKNYIPIEMKKKWTGKGLPLWKWTEGYTTLLFFVSERDFVNYSEKDEFLSLAIPDSKAVLCLFSTGETLNEKKPLFNWLEQASKLRFAELPSLLSDFLLSASGEIQGEIPGDLSLCLKNFKSNNDVLLSRKTEIYSEAIDEIKVNLVPKPQVFDKGALPDVDTIWGEGHMDRDIAVIGISLSFIDVSSQEKQLLAETREFFRSGREGRGNGDLNPLMGRGGYIALCNELLPRYGRKKELKDSEPLGRLKGYWRDDERNMLADLSRILPLEHFLKLNHNENMNRLLEAFWKSVRKEFDSNGLEDLIQRYQREINPALDDCSSLEIEARADLGISGIDFGEKEKIIKAKDSIKRFSEIAQDSVKDDGDASRYIKSVIDTLMSVMTESFEKDMRSLLSSSGSSRRSVGDLKKVAVDLLQNFWEYRKAVKYLGIKEDDMKKIVSEQMLIGGHPTLLELETLTKEKKEFLEDISKNLGLLNKKLDGLQNIFKMEV
jgi:hypothetical protein